MKRFPLLLSLLSLMACVEEESQCALVRTAEGEIEAHCPRRDPIVLELDEEEAERLQGVEACAYRPEQPQAVLVCDDLTFDLQGKRVEDGTSPPQEDMSSSSPGDREDDMFEEPSVQGVQTPSRRFARSSVKRWCARMVHVHRVRILKMGALARAPCCLDMEGASCARLLMRTVSLWCSCPKGKRRSPNAAPMRKLSRVQTRARSSSRSSREKMAHRRAPASTDPL